jgi:hypothetical protein
MEVVSYNRYAGFFRRFIAFIIDSIVIRIGLTILFFHSVDFDMYDIHNLFSRNTILVELILMAYFVFCELCMAGHAGQEASQYKSGG